MGEVEARFRSGKSEMKEDLGACGGAWRRVAWESIAFYTLASQEETQETSVCD